MFAHPPLSPDLASSNFYIFTKLKEWAVNVLEMMKNAVNNWHNRLATEELTRDY
jgi:hypothetical protein